MSTHTEFKHYGHCADDTINAAVDKMPIQHSTYDRIQTFANTYYEHMPINKAATHVVIFKCIKSVDTEASEINEQYQQLIGLKPAGTTVKKHNAKIDANYAHILFDDAPRFILTSPSLTSSDGEFRQRFVEFKKIANMPPEYRAVIDAAIRHIKNREKKKDIEFMFQILPSPVAPLSERNKDAMLETIRRDSLAYVLFAIGFIIELYKKRYDIADNHINPNYARIVYSDYDIGQFDYIGFSEYFSNYMTSPDSFGFKIIPLNIVESYHPHNQIFTPWREIEVNKLVSKLIYNSISPHFAIYANWTYINASLSLFDNESMHKRIIEGERAGRMMRTLQRAQLDTFVSKTRKIPLSREFGELYELLVPPIEMIERQIVMSSIALSCIVEYIGRTLYDIPKLSMNAEYISDIGPIFPVLFRKTIFEILYAFLCMNVHLQICSSDSHLNNITLNKYKRIPAEIRPHVIYYLAPKGGQDSHNNIYIFPHRGTYAGIIDFSRCVVSPKMLNQMAGKHVNKKRLKFMESQDARIADVYKRFFPEFWEAKNLELMLVSKREPQKFFNLFVAIDAYTFSRNLLIHFEDCVLGGISIPSEIVELLKRINAASRECLELRMLDLINGNYTECVCMWDIITANFADDSYAAWQKTHILRDVSVVDVFRFNRKLTYDPNDPGKTPPYIVDTRPLIAEHIRQTQNQMRAVDILSATQKELSNRITKPIGIIKAYKQYIWKLE
jgi:hypothetical protein